MEYDADNRVHASMLSPKDFAINKKKKKKKRNSNMLRGIMFKGSWGYYANDDLHCEERLTPYDKRVRK